MRSTGRSLIALAVAVAVAGSLVSCSSTSAGNAGAKQTVVFWQFDSGDAQVAAFKSAKTAFEAKNPDITVDIQIVPWSDQQQKITTAIATGGLPDVSYMGNDVVSQYVASKDLAPLTSYIDQWSKDEGHDVTADFWPGDVGYYKSGNDYYGAPLYDETRMMYYRTDLFKKAGIASPPKTWAEAEQDATLLKAQGVAVPWALPESNQYATVQTFMSVYLSYGAELIGSDGKCGLNTAAFQDALTYYTGIAKKGLTDRDAANLDGAAVEALFTTGKAAMFIGGPYTNTLLTTKSPELKGKFAIAPIPAGPKGQFGFLGGVPLVMWNASKVKDAAAKWMHFATSPEGALGDIAKSVGILPGRVSLAQKAPFSDQPLAGFSAQLKSSYPYQYPAKPVAKMGEIEASSIQTAVQAVATGSKSADQATKDLCTSINTILAS